LMYNRGAFKIK